MPVSHDIKEELAITHDEKPDGKTVNGIQEGNDLKGESSKSTTTPLIGKVVVQQGGLAVDTCFCDAEPKKYRKAEDYGANVKFLKVNDQIKELQTTLRDRETSRGDFIFYADRLIRLVVEEGLNQLPFDECTVITSTGAQYHGLKFRRGICGVSIVRCGEAMEKGLRECCRSIRIGKVLIKSDEETNKPKVCYARFPPDIQERRVLLMYPLLNSGATVTAAIELLGESGVSEKNIILVTLFATPVAVSRLTSRYPDLILLTTEIHEDCPTHFGKKYFGTD